MKRVISFMILLFAFQNSFCQVKSTFTEKLLAQLSYNYSVQITSVCFRFKSDSSVKLLGLSYFRSTNEINELIDQKLDSLTHKNTLFKIGTPLYDFFLQAPLIKNETNIHEYGIYNLIDYLSDNLNMHIVGTSIQIISMDSVKLNSLTYYDVTGNLLNVNANHIDSFFANHNLIQGSEFLFRSSELAIIIEN